MGRNKHWVLLANTLDSSLLKNRIVEYMGTAMGLDFTTRSLPVDLVVNGMYMGSYVLGQNVRIDESRIEIARISEDAAWEPEVTGGYLLMMEPAADDPYGVITTERGVTFSIKTPDLTDYSDEHAAGRDAQVAYMKGFLNKLEEAIYSDDLRDKNGVHYSEYMDVESAASYWWIQEFTENGDAFITGSTYLYKDQDGKLCWGPLWDFDLSLDIKSEDIIFSNTRMPWLDHLRENDPEYRRLLLEKWEEFDAVLKDITREGGILDTYAAEIRNSWINDYDVYYSYDSYFYPSYDPETSFEESISKLRDYIDYRRTQIESNINMDSIGVIEEEQMYWN